MSTDVRAHPDLARLAAIDVGTNSIRLVVAEILPDRSYRIVDDEKIVTRLGQGLGRKGRLHEQAMQNSAEAIARLKSIADGMNVAAIRAVATCAVREACNGAEFAARVRQAAALELEIISAEEEARLAYLSVVNAFDLGDTPTAIVDVGGGSTEVVVCSGPVIERISTIPLGAVRLSERFDLGAGPITDDAYRILRRGTNRELKRAMPKPPFEPHIIIGTGGTFTNLAAMVMQRGAPSRDTGSLPFPVRGYELQRSDVRHFLDQLRKMPARERARVPGLNPARADIIVPGLVIIDRVLKRLGTNRLRVHDQGIRAGILYEMIDALESPGAPDAVPMDRLTGVRHFAASCHHDHAHAEHVLHLSLQIFDGLRAGAHDHDDDAAWSSPESRGLLHAAALLHDVGYMINYSRHHKHSYHLILHSGLWGFNRRELEVIANIARYHRGAKPKIKHDNFQRLDSTDRDIVLRLAAILRLAVGLDRSHGQRVENIEIARTNRIATFIADATSDPSVELWGAERKSSLFEEAFGLGPRFEWAGSTATHEEQAG